MATFLTAEEAASLIANGDQIGFSGFTAAGAAKAIPAALAARAIREHEAGRPFQVGVFTGASTGRSLDGALAAAEAIGFRTPYQSDALLRNQINAGKVRFVDMHLSMLPQAVRYGFLGALDWAVIEVADYDPVGRVLLTSSVGASNTFLGHAKRILLEWNAAQPAALLGLHDIFEPEDPPVRRELPIFSVRDRAGETLASFDPAKLAGIVKTNQPDEAGAFAAITPEARKISENIAEFLAAEIRLGRIPATFLPLQSGVGNIANSVLAALGDHPGIPAFTMYTEVLQDAALALLQSGRLTFASTCALTLSPERQQYLYRHLDDYRDKLVLRPQEISNHPELVRRLGLISLNTALEFDLAGNVNSTHVLGSQLMNGIGGSGDFARNAFLSLFSCPSTTKDGKISTVVPMVSHCDHNEHSVQILVTEQGVADLRGRDPRDRAEQIINNCAHPAYRDQLRAYIKASPNGHHPQSLSQAFGFHQRFINQGSMLE